METIEKTKNETLRGLINERVVVNTVDKYDFWVIYVTDEEVCLKSGLDGKLSIHNIKQTRFFKKENEIL